MLTIFGSVYLIGVALGLTRTDAPWPGRMVLAALWPAGPLAGVLTIAGLLVVAAMAFPWFGLLLAGTLTATAWRYWQ